ncbi:hypothetical protein ACFL3G_07695 [Planctomycetota bacterium]
MQVDGVSLQSLYGVRLNDDGRILYEDREKLRNSPDVAKDSASSPADQENPVNTKDLLSSNVTLDQLLAKEEDLTRVKAYGERSEEEMRIENLTMRIYLRYLSAEGTPDRGAAMKDAVESGRYKAAADRKIDELLGSVNALLKDVELTSEQSEALKIFNSQVNQVKNEFKPFWYDKNIRKNGWSACGMLTGLDSAFDTLIESFNSVTDSTPTIKSELEMVFAAKVNDIRSGMKATFGLSDSTEEDITGIITRFIAMYAGTENLTTEEEQLAQDFMPKIIEIIKKNINHSIV